MSSAHALTHSENGEHAKIGPLASQTMARNEAQPSQAITDTQHNALSDALQMRLSVRQRAGTVKTQRVGDDSMRHAACRAKVDDGLRETYTAESQCMESQRGTRRERRTQQSSCLL